MAKVIASSSLVSLSSTINPTMCKGGNNVVKHAVISFEFSSVCGICTLYAVLIKCRIKILTL